MQLDTKTIDAILECRRSVADAHQASGLAALADYIRTLPVNRPYVVEPPVGEPRRPIRESSTLMTEDLPHDLRLPAFGRYADSRALVGEAGWWVSDEAQSMCLQAWEACREARWGLGRSVASAFDAVKPLERNKQEAMARSLKYLDHAHASAQRATDAGPALAATLDRDWGRLLAFADAVGGDGRETILARAHRDPIVVPDINIDGPASTVAVAGAVLADFADHPELAEVATRWAFLARFAAECADIEAFRLAMQAEQDRREREGRMYIGRPSMNYGRDCY